MASSKKSLYRIGALSKKMGKTTRALRFYEQLGLLVPQERSDAGYRLYSEEAITQVRWIETLQSLGFSLGEIKSFLDDLEKAQNAPSKMKQVKEFYRERLAETQKSIHKLQSLATELSASLEALQDCAQCTRDELVHTCRSCLSKEPKIPSLIEPLLFRIEQQSK